MIEKKGKVRKVPRKNYYIALFTFIGVILATFYIAKWYRVFNEEKIKQSYLVSNKVITNELKSISELEDVLSESPEEYFIYISYTNDPNVYEMEKDLKKVIKQYNLEDRIYYLNVTKIKDNQSLLIDDLNQALGLNGEKITNIPTIVYFKDHNLVPGGIIHKDYNSLMQSSDFEQLLEVLEVEKK